MKPWQWIFWIGVLTGGISAIIATNDNTFVGDAITLVVVAAGRLLAGVVACSQGDMVEADDME